MEGNGPVDAPTPASATDDGSQVRRWEKRRCALLLGFVGTGYHGFQNNPDVPTIEGKLENALNELGMLGPNYEGRLGTVCAHRRDTTATADAMHTLGHTRCLPQLQWSRSARTDKGVHAAGQVVSLLFHHPPGKSYEEMTDMINEKLPADIRVYTIQRVTKSFNAKNHCELRQYEYILPTWLLRTEHREAPLAGECAGARGETSGELYPATPAAEALLPVSSVAVRAFQAHARSVEHVGRRALAEAHAMAALPEAAPFDWDKLTLYGRDTAFLKKRLLSWRTEKRQQMAASQGVEPRPEEPTVSVEELRRLANEKSPRPRPDYSYIPLHECRVDGTLPIAAHANPWLAPAQLATAPLDGTGAEQLDAAPRAAPADIVAAQAAHVAGTAARREAMAAHAAKLRAEAAADPWRLPEAEWKRLVQLAGCYSGSRSYHNFTPHLTAGDATCIRVMQGVDVSRPFMIGDMEVVRFTLRGQSFVLNQIRHMIGLLVDAMRGAAPPWIMDIVFSRRLLMRLPLAPAEGLFLHHVRGIADTSCESSLVAGASLHSSRMHFHSLTCLLTNVLPTGRVPQLQPDTWPLAWRCQLHGRQSPRRADCVQGERDLA